MSDPVDVKRTLARLAKQGSVGVRSRFGAEDDYRAVIDAASDAITELAEAAEFVESVGLDRLDAAIEAATDAGDYAAARRGRRAYTAITELRVALEDDIDDTQADGTDSAPSDQKRSDHFRSGHGTNLGGGCKRDSK